MTYEQCLNFLRTATARVEEQIKQDQDRIEELERDRVDKAEAWDAIAAKNARIEELEALLDTWQVQYENGRDLSHVNTETAKALVSQKPAAACRNGPARPRGI
jgi:chaperonin cofactor prefoldin